MWPAGRFAGVTSSSLLQGNHQVQSSQYSPSFPTSYASFGTKTAQRLHRLPLCSSSPRKSPPLRKCTMSSVPYISEFWPSSSGKLATRSI